MTEWIEGIVKHTETELHLLGLDQTNLGPLIVDFIKNLQQTLGNHPTAMKSILRTVAHLVDGKPVAPITETDFVDDKCTRCSYIYKSGEKYYNDRAVVFKKSYDDPSSQYLYQGQQRSKREITLPYVLREEIVLIP